MNLNKTKDGQPVVMSKMAAYSLTGAFVTLIGTMVFVDGIALVVHFMFIITFSGVIIQLMTRTMILGLLLFRSRTVIKGNRVIIYSLFLILLLVSAVGTIGFDKIVLSKILITLPIGIIFSIACFKYQLNIK